MKNIGAILGWKFSHTPGICTVDDVITEWPEALGAVPTVEQVAAWSAEFDTAQAALESVKTADASAVAFVKSRPIIQYLATHSPAECNAKVQADVTDLASAKVMLGNFAEALCVLTKQSLR